MNVILYCWKNWLTYWRDGGHPCAGTKLGPKLSFWWLPQVYWWKPSSATGKYFISSHHKGNILGYRKALHLINTWYLHLFCHTVRRRSKQLLLPNTCHYFPLFFYWTLQQGEDSKRLPMLACRVLMLVQKSGLCTFFLDVFLSPAQWGYCKAGRWHLSPAGITEQCIFSVYRREHVASVLSLPQVK